MAKRKLFLGKGLFKVIGKLFNVKYLFGKKLNRRRLFKQVYLAGILVLFVLAVYGIYIASYADKVYPNVCVAGMEVSGMDKKELEKALSDRYIKASKSIFIYQYKDKKWEMSPDDIKLAYDVDKTVSVVLSKGREKDASRRLWSRLGAIFSNTEVKSVYSYDEKLLGDFVEKVSSDIDTPEKDATGVIKNNNVTFVQERNGLRVQQDRLILAIKNGIDKIDNRLVNIPVAVSYPKVTLGDTENARQQVLTMLKADLNLKWQKGSWRVASDIFELWIKFKADNDGKEHYQLAAYVDNEEVKSYLKKISKEIDGAPKNAKLTITDGVVSVVEPSKEGYVFDQEASVKPITESITAGIKTDVELAVKTVQPDVRGDNIESLGIREIVGIGETNFKGSTASRVQNIANGTRIVSGTLIKPGEEFSAVKSIGNVDASTGFVLGLVIKGAETVPEYGGGLCQVSSTLYRAALNTGLKITERKNHAYRVGYYETDGDGKKIGSGLDSTIYGPHPDLRFVNDTGNWILIMGKIVKTKLTFEFWGTKDGRVATIEGPFISNEKPAPPAEYINTDTLYAGQKKQLESSHPGATSVVNYKVVKNGQEIIKQTFKSVYKPWGAKYLVGTKPLPEGATTPPSE